MIYIDYFWFGSKQNRMESQNHDLVVGKTDRNHRTMIISIDSSQLYWLSTYAADWIILTISDLVVGKTGWNHKTMITSIEATHISDS